jgi:hypothetical protein
VQGIDPRTSLAAFQTIRQTRQDDEDRRQQQTIATQRRADDAEMRTERRARGRRKPASRTRCAAPPTRTRRNRLGEGGRRGADRRSRAGRGVVEAGRPEEACSTPRSASTNRRVTAGGLLNTDDANLGPAYARERARLIEGGMATPDQIPDGTTFQSPAQLRAFLQERLAAAMEPEGALRHAREEDHGGAEGGRQAEEPAAVHRHGREGEVRSLLGQGRGQVLTGAGRTSPPTSQAGRITEWTKRTPTGTGAVA